MSNNSRAELPSEGLAAGPGYYNDEAEEKKFDEHPSLDPSQDTLDHNAKLVNKVVAQQESTVTPSISSEQQLHDTFALAGGEKAGPRTKSGKGRLAVVLRSILLDLPLFLLFATYVASMAMEKWAQEYWFPQLDLVRWSPERAEEELTYYHRVCYDRDQTAHDPTDLVVQEHMTSDEATQLMNRHGAVVFPNLLSEGTAAEVRNFILQQNLKGENMIYVIENKNRWSFYIEVDQHPSIPKALREVLTNPVLVPALEKIIGKNPAVIEFTGITSAYGAVEQRWHQDVVPEGNGAKYGRNFVPSYSLFIPLQNTTRAMGATEICPGSHMCAAGCEEYCPRTGFPVSGRQDNWPLGWGALVNQQTSHRGPAHVDADGMARVLFIITFAPRPNFGEKEVETRLIGQMGSYSLHWSQWGHTLKEFQNPAKYMQQPWRSLRSLGLYKPSGRQWGWDFFTQVSFRISNEDVGYSRNDFDQFIDKGGFKFLPRSLHGVVNEETDSSAAWVEYAVNTFRRVQEFVKQVYLSCLAISVIGSLLFLLSAKAKMRVLLSTTLRLGLIHAIVLSLAWSAFQRIGVRSWARNLRAGRIYQWPETVAGMSELPAVMPLEADVLIFDNMKSRYLASHTEVLEVFHPGNAAWHKRLEQVSAGYSSLTPSLQNQLVKSTLQWTRSASSRILMQNQFLNWAEADVSSATRFCHKELMTKSNKYVKIALRELNYLFSEVRFGYWRETVLHQKHIFSLLLSLQDDFLGFHRDGGVTIAKFKSEQRPKAPAPFSRGPMTLPSTTRSTQRSPSRRLRGELADITEPYPGAWLQEGDVIEATYQGEFVEWYRGSIVTASSNRRQWDVVYDDGDEDFNLCLECVRPFMPYLVGELIQVRESVGDDFYPGRVSRHYPEDDTYDISMSDGDFRSRVASLNMRRYTMSNLGISVGDTILARFPGEPENKFFRGTVEKINSDGTVAVAYDDGDYSDRISRKDIKINKVE